MKSIMKFCAIVFLSITTFAYAETININTADSSLITSALKGIGPAKASAIIEYRSKNGNFTHLDELLNIPGIGEKTLEQIKDQIVFDDIPSTQVREK